MSPPHLIVITGPTATGKSGVAIEVARRINGEIVSVDSMQVYRGMNIGTGKVSKEERAGIPHHLVDIVNVNQRFDVCRFCVEAQKAIELIFSRGHTPILCGGTGLYYSALAFGLGSAPAANPELRQLIQSTPQDILLEELRLKDPVYYKRVDHQNPRRIIRAIEVIRLTGTSYSEVRASWASTAQNKSSTEVGIMGYPTRWFGLERERGDLRMMISDRIDGMFNTGLVKETQSLLEEGLAQNPTAYQAIGYRQVSEYLSGLMSLPETVLKIKTLTRQYAKRQMTWFKNQLPLNWINQSSISSRDETASILAEQCVQQSHGLAPAH